MASTPPLDLSWKVMWCERHLEPYRADWPSGAGVAMIMLFSEAVKMPAIADASNNDARNLGRALERFSPICCFVSHEVIETIYKATGRQT
jgi:hypothetical protein